MVSKGLIGEFQKIVGKENIFTNPEDLVSYSYDGSYLSGYRPEVVITTANTAEVSQVVFLANKNGIPLIPRGGGTGVVGGALPVKEGIILSLQRMRTILEIDEENLTATVQPGVITAELHSSVEAKGLFYPPDPSSLQMCTLGGNVAVNSSGPRGFKYGVTGDYVMGLEVVLASGEIIRTGGKTIKNVSGYDLTSLMVGSEGTLGIVTEIIVQLIPLPEAKKTLLAVFDDLESGAHAVSAIIRAKIIPTSLELLDQEAIRLIEAYINCGLPVDAASVILIELDGSKFEIDVQVEKIKSLCSGHNCKEVKIAKSKEEAELLWRGRRSIMGAMANAAVTVISEDATVPRSKITHFIKRIKEIAKKYDIKIPILGHTGDGNLHPCLLVDERDQEKMSRVEPCIAEMFETALSMGGTLSGEHGIGLIKKDYMRMEHLPGSLAMMKSIKKVFDPKGTLNPGKLFLEE